MSGTNIFDIHYSPNDKFELVGYTDSDWASSMDDQKSTSGYIFSFGSRVVSWSSKKEATMAPSFGEAEYIAVTSTSCQ